MDIHDLEIIQKHVGEDSGLATLYREHMSYEKQLSKLDNKLFLSPQEAVLKKELQKKKLVGRDKMETILRRYREGQH